jgi:hypothetical protein
MGMDQERHAHRGDVCPPLPLFFFFSAPLKALGCVMGGATRTGVGTQAAWRSPSLRLCGGAMQTGPHRNGPPSPFCLPPCTHKGAV